MRKIIFVSRLDGDCSLGAFALCEIAPDLAQIYPDLQIIIIGGGEKFSEICQKAYSINQIINRELIFTKGNVENPSMFFEKSSLFIGVSRACLEAMACSLPVILFGDEGQLGLLDEKTLPFAQKTNFTCRGASRGSDFAKLCAFLFDEICRYFELSPKRKDELSSFSREIIEKEYSAHKMAQETVDFYEKIIEEYSKSHKLEKQKPKKIAICGYYGRGNLGDEAILTVLTEKLLLKYPTAKICVIKSKNLIKIIKTLYKSDLFVFGGGSLLQNSTSNASLFYYISIISAAKIFSKRTIMLSNGIGPIKNGSFLRNLPIKSVARAVNSFDFISVRDKKSQKVLEKLLPKRKIHLIPDPALIFDKTKQTDVPIDTKKECFLYIPCKNGLKNSKISSNEIVKSLSLIAELYRIQPIIAVLNELEDLSIANETNAQLNGAKTVCVSTPSELFSLLSQSKFVISQRYHGSLFATMCSAPVLCVSNDPKMKSLCSDFGLFPVQTTEILKDSGKLEKNLLHALRFYDKNEGKIRDIVEYAADLTQQGIDKLIL